MEDGCVFGISANRTSESVDAFSEKGNSIWNRKRRKVHLCVLDIVDLILTEKDLEAFYASNESYYFFNFSLLLPCDFDFISKIKDIICSHREQPSSNGQFLTRLELIIDLNNSLRFVLFISILSSHHYSCVWPHFWEVVV